MLWMYQSSAEVDSISFSIEVSANFIVTNQVSVQTFLSLVKNNP